MDLDLRIGARRFPQQRLVLSGEHVQRDAKVGVVQARRRAGCDPAPPLTDSPRSRFWEKPAHGACGGDGVAEMDWLER